MRSTPLLAHALLFALSLSASVCKHGCSTSWDLQKFSTLVVFGDSYSDDNRLNYFISNNGQAPPPGWVDPVNYDAADGGRPWPEYVKQYAGVNLYNYAVAGAVCSNLVTPRYLFLINGDFPAVEQYEVPAFVADSTFTEPDGSKFFNAPQDQTVYSMWIGTNDLGVNALLTDSQVPGTNIVNYTDCVFDQLASLYDKGARYFVLMNVIPLNFAPLYALPSAGGVGANQYWPDKPSNLTQISYKMMEEVSIVNAIYQYRLPYMIQIMRAFPGARFALMDVHSLFTDMYLNPAHYLNGSLPAGSTGYIHHCSPQQTDCYLEPSPDSYLWYDELHPSEQAFRNVAKEFVNVVQGESKYATYWSNEQGPHWGPS